MTPPSASFVTPPAAQSNDPTAALEAMKLNATAQSKPYTYTAPRSHHAIKEGAEPVEDWEGNYVSIYADSLDRLAD